MSATAEAVGSRSAVINLAKLKWRSSGLTDADAKKLKLTPLAGSAVAALAPNFHATGSLQIPYFDLKGKPTKFYRLRYLEPLPGFAGIIEKPQRYAQKAGTINEVYYPPLLELPWSEVAENPEVAVCVTEGELKSASGCAHGIPTIGLGGVNTFKSSKNGISLFKSLEQFKWEKRRVHIVFDNDITHKIEVMRAQRSLAQELLSRGAEVFFLNLPPGPAKGLDDFLVAHGVEAFAKLLVAAVPFAESEALWAMNEEVVFIRRLDTVVERATSMFMDPNKFMHHIYANRYFMEQVEAGSGKNKHIVLEKTPIAPRWMGWEYRAQLNKIVYEPGLGRVVNGDWNTWEGWGCMPKKGDVGPWKGLMDFLFKEDHKTRRWFEKWCAYPLQHPGAKMYSAVVMWSRAKRLGKSLAFMALSKIYGDNAVTIGSKQLKGGFNTWARNRQLVVGEEITAGEARVDADWLKSLITQPFVTINEKFQPEYSVVDHMNHAYLSNHPDAMFLEDGDERFLIHEVRQAVPAPREFYETVDKWFKGTGPQHLFYYLLNLDLGDFNPRAHAPRTASKDAMIRHSKSDVGIWIMQLQEDAPTALKALGDRQAKSCDLFTPAQLYRAFDPEGRGRGRASEASMGRALSAAGFRQVNGEIPVSTSTGVHRLYAVRNVMQWEQASRKEIKSHYDSYFGAEQIGEV